MSLASQVSALATRVGQEIKALTGRTISAGTGLTGGGSLAANRTLSLSSGSITSLGKADTSVQAYSGQVFTVRSLSQATYDGLGSKDANTLYVIV